MRFVLSYKVVFRWDLISLEQLMMRRPNTCQLFNIWFIHSKSREKGDLGQMHETTRIVGIKYTILWFSFHLQQSTNNHVSLEYVAWAHLNLGFQPNDKSCLVPNHKWSRMLDFISFGMEKKNTEKGIDYCS